MNIEITRGRLEMYDILTHLIFFCRSHKISKRVLIDENGATTRDWQKVRTSSFKDKKAYSKRTRNSTTHTANILGRTFKELTKVYSVFALPNKPERLLQIVYWLGKLAIDEEYNTKRTVTFSPVLRERLAPFTWRNWANRIKETLQSMFLERPIHIISANLHML